VVIAYSRGSAAHLLGWRQPKSGTSPAVQNPLRSRVSNSAPFGPPVDEEQLKQTEVREEPMKSERDGINPAAKPSGTGCVECLAQNGWWLHLRRCAECGHIGCCDTSPNQHASKHGAATGHPIITSFEPDERWFYDYRTEEFLTGPKLHGFTLLTVIRWINRSLDRPERCLQTGKRCFTNRGRLFGSDLGVTRPPSENPTG
jgi:hypothetical protein